MIIGIGIATLVVLGIALYTFIGLVVHEVLDFGEGPLKYNEEPAAVLWPIIPFAWLVIVFVRFIDKFATRFVNFFRTLKSKRKPRVDRTTTDIPQAKVHSEG